MDRVPLCFSCGLPVTTPPRLNELPDGSPCPTCRARALDVVAPALPRALPSDPRFADSDPDQEQEQESDLRAADRPFDPPGSADDYPEPA
jgi:hypothetical protein